VIAAGLETVIADALAEDDPKAASARVVTAIERADLPPALTEAIRHAYLDLGAGEVAVRSSARSEDGAAASFAGQYETVLGIVGSDALMAAIRRCWASLWSVRALAYRRRAGLEQGPAAMAVVVQQMVAAVQSGVAFTLDPASGSRDVIVIEAVAGSGRTLVEGKTTPHRYAIGKGRDPTTLAEGVLDASGLLSVVELAQRVEAWEGKPQDIEWALDAGGRIYLLQARPITSMRAAGQEVVTRWTRDNVGEVIPGTVTPLSWSILDPLSNDSAVAVMRRLGMSVPSAGTLFDRFYGKVYLNQTLFQAVMNRFYPSKTGWHAYPRLALTMLRALWLLSRLPSESESVTRSILRRRHAAQDLELDALTEASLIERLKAWRDLDCHAMRVHIGITVIAEVLSQALEKCLAVRRPQGAGARSVTTGLKRMRSAEAGEAVGAMARWVCKDDALRSIVLETGPDDLEGKLKSQAAGQALWAKVQAFLAEHGHMASQEFELSVPRWRDDPKIILAALQSQVRAASEGPTEAPAVSRLAAIAQIQQELSPLRRWIFRLLLHWVTAFTVHRENLKYHLVMAHSRLRDLYLALAARFVADGRLANAEDVFFLTVDEVRRLVDESEDCDYRKRVSERRQAWKADQEATPPPALDRWPDGRIRSAAPTGVTGDTDGQPLHGLAASPGTYVGRARVALSLEGAGHLEPGEILVIQAATPGWSPLLWAAGALVTEIGGTLSHSAIIAREYGLPAVLNVRDATRLVHTGQRVRVDGSRGTVQLLEGDK
jgi:pyruvate,water dikinase